MKSTIRQGQQKRLGELAYLRDKCRADADRYRVLQKYTAHTDIWMIRELSKQRRLSVKMAWEYRRQIHELKKDLAQ